MVIIDDSLQYLENLEVDKKQVLSSEVVESMRVTYVGERRCSIDTLVGTFEYFVLSQSTYNHLRQDFQLPTISTLTKMTCKQKQLYNRSLFSSSAMIISDMCINFGVGRFIKMQTFSSIIFENCILHVYVLDKNLETSDLSCKIHL